jgi:Ca2+-binding RTX toxin-like protein
MTIGTNGDDLFGPADANPNIDGAGGNDFIEGSTADNILTGGDGNDVVAGSQYLTFTGNGNPTGAAGDEPYDLTSFVTPSGNDTLNGGAGIDSLFGADGNDIINAGDGDDTGEFAGYTGNWYFGGAFGGDGNDIIDGGAGNDRLLGENGNDTVRGGTGNDDLRGEAGDDQLFGDDGADVLAGGSGKNIIDGGTGVDTAFIGANFANVRFNWTLTGDVSISGTDTDGQVFKAIVTNVESFNFNGTSTKSLAEIKFTDSSGTNIDDFIRVAANPVVNALGGNDFIIGANANDQLNGDDGNDVILGIAYAPTGFTGDGSSINPYKFTSFNTASGNDTLNGGNGIDAIYGGDGDDIINGGSGDDSGTMPGHDDNSFVAGLFGGDGNDIINGEDGNDYIEAGSGKNTVDGGIGSDTVHFNANLADVQFNWSANGDIAITGLESGVAFKTTIKNVESFSFNGAVKSLAEIKPIDINGNSKKNKLNGTANGEIMDGKKGNDTINGNDGDDKLIGGKGNDKLKGGNGDDWLYGGKGKDTLTGSAGADTFVFNAKPTSANRDTLFDFLVADDTIALDNSVFTALTDGTLASTAFALGKKAADADDRIIYNSKKGEILYDVDGVGSKKAVVIAKIGTGLTITNDDFLVI